MKSLKITGSIVLILSFMLSGYSSSAQKKTEEIKIQTSAQCEMCKERIEKELTFTKGVSAVNLDLETKIVTVEYKSSKTDPEKIREAIAGVGYDADEVQADPEAYAKLPACCQKGGHD